MDYINTDYIRLANDTLSSWTTVKVFLNSVLWSGENHPAGTTHNNITTYINNNKITTFYNIIITK